MFPTPQPAKGFLAVRRITNRQVAAGFDPPMSEAFVGRVLNGQQPPSRRFREGVSRQLGLPEDALFRVAFDVDEVAS